MLRGEEAEEEWGWGEPRGEGVGEITCKPSKKKNR